MKNVFQKKCIFIKLSIKRGKKNAARRLKKNNCFFSKLYQNKNSLSTSYKKLLDSYSPQHVWTSPKNTVSCPIPSVFSFIENCENTVSFFNDIINQSINNKTKRLIFNQKSCTRIDLCAESVAAVLLNDLFKERGIRLSGQYPDDEKLKHIVRASGVTKFLKISHDNPDDMHLLGLIEGAKSKSKATQSSEKEMQSSKLIKYIDECLHFSGWELSKKGKLYLLNIVSEVLDNAECHSLRSNWWINAYLRCIDKNKFECQLVIFNFGRPICKSMQTLPPENALRKKIESLIHLHRSHGFFSKKWDEDVLWTLYSLQEGVSRIVDENGSTTDHGQGLSDLIEFFQKIGDSKAEHPVMALVSGSVYIRFDNDYRINHVSQGSVQRRQIAFNLQNDLTKPPDSHKVMKLKSFFPGTVFSFKFYIDNDYLKDLNDESRN